MQTEQQIFQSKMINQSLAATYNCIHTGRQSEAINMLGVVQRIEPENPLVPEFFRLIAAKTGLCDEPNLADQFGKVWGGENLDGCTIEVFCDQGMGDLINLLRYLKLMKSRWCCHIVLNCYAYFEQFERLLKDVDYIDEFVKYHRMCDYFTDIFCLPTILSGIKLPLQYPAHFALAMEKGVPPQPILVAPPTFSSADISNHKPEKPRVGVSWMSNPDNQLSVKKSIPLEIIEHLKSPDYDLWSLHPNECPPFMNKIILTDLYDTAAVISCLDYVVSVDTVVLHLAGAMQAPTYGLIPDDCDPRWGTENDLTVWYPSVVLIRQEGDWLYRIKEVKECLESIFRAR